MAQETNSFVDKIKKFGSDLGIPAVDVDKLADLYRKNLDTLTQTATTASESAKFVASKQVEIAQSAFRETLDQVRNFKPAGIRRKFSPGSRSSCGKRSTRRSTIRATSLNLRRSRETMR